MNGPGLLPLDLSFVQPNFVGKGYRQKIIPKTHLSGLSGVFCKHQSSRIAQKKRRLFNSKKKT